MKVLMIGTPTCTHCKRIRSRIEDVCNEKGYGFQYKDYDYSDEEMVKTFYDLHIRTAPVFFIYKEESSEPVVAFGDNVFLELNKIVE